MPAKVSQPAISVPPPSFNMAQYVLAAGALTPEKPALIVLGGQTDTWTYDRLARSVRGTAAGLLERGLHPGDRLLMRLGNSPTFPVVYLAAIAVGIIPVPTSSQLTLPEVAKIVAELRPVAAVTAMGVACPPDLPAISQAEIASFASLPPAPFALGSPDRPAYIIYTSGTSGKPRAVVHAHRAIWARRMMWDGWYGLRADDRLLHAGAFNWTYTLGTGLMDPWAIGATALIARDGTAPEDLPRLMADAQATIFAAAPGVYRRALRGDVPPLPTLRHGLSAGEKLPETVRAAWRAATGTDVFEAYGMSECSTFISGSPTRPAPAGSLGFAQPGRHIALVNASGPVPSGTPGQIAVHRDDLGLMLGYLDQPGETAARMQGDWFLTGDIGVADAAGAISYAGRVDDMMNAGGYRVSPIEVEDALTAHPAISEAAAAEVSVRADVRVIAAFYTAPHLINEAELAAFLSQRLAAYKVPRLFVHVASLPRGANNKLLRRQLRQEWEAQHGQT